MSQVIDDYSKETENDINKNKTELKKIEIKNWFILLIAYEIL